MFLTSVACNRSDDAVEALVNSEDSDALARYQAGRRAILAIIIVIAFGTLVFVGSLHDELMHEYIETLGLVLILVGIGGRLWATLYIGGANRLPSCRPGLTP
jgi:protein-S-isoprenylcysteine O-methyltransferase Ste14